MGVLERLQGFEDVVVLLAQVWREEEFYNGCCDALNEAQKCRGVRRVIAVMLGSRCRCVSGHESGTGNRCDAIAIRTGALVCGFHIRDVVVSGP